MMTNIPNNGEFSTNRANNGFLPLTKGASPVNPPNNAAGDRRGGSSSLAGAASPVNPPNDGRFANGDKGTSGPASANPSAMEPGRGAVPVNPFLVSGGIMPATRQADSAGTYRGGLL
jgi:hypothetical protein